MPTCRSCGRPFGNESRQPGLVDLGVDRGRAQLRVPHQALDLLQGGAGGQHARRERLPQPVRTELRDPGMDADLPDRSHTPFADNGWTGSMTVQNTSSPSTLPPRGRGARSIPALDRPRRAEEARRSDPRNRLIQTQTTPSIVRSH